MLYVGYSHIVNKYYEGEVWTRGVSADLLNTETSRAIIFMW
jgi:hypothetical protein